MSDLTLIFATTTASACLIGYFIGKVVGENSFRKYFINEVLRINNALGYGPASAREVINDIMRELDSDSSR